MANKQRSDVPAVMKPPSGFTEPQKHQCFLMFCAGMRPCDIAKDTGIPENTIVVWNKRFGWAAQKKQLDEYYMKLHPVEHQPIPTVVKNGRKGELREKFQAHMEEIAESDAEHWKKLGASGRLEVATAIAPLANVHRKTLDLDKEETGEKGHISLTFLSQANQPGMVKVIESEKVRVIEDTPSADDPAFD